MTTTTVSIGIFAYGTAIGWLGTLFLRPPPLFKWQSLAFAAVLCAAGIVLGWCYGGIEGARFLTLGLSAGALGGICARFNHVVRQ